MGGPNRTDADWWEFARGLGVKLQRARLAKGMSQEAVAHAAGISTFTYQKFEKGDPDSARRWTPGCRILFALAGALEIGVGKLVEPINF